MRKHVDREGAVRSVTMTRSEWRRRRRGRRIVERGRAYVWVMCEQQGRVRVRAMLVPDRSPKARRRVSA